MPLTIRVDFDKMAAVPLQDMLLSQWPGKGQNAATLVGPNFWRQVEQEPFVVDGDENHPLAQALGALRIRLVPILASDVPILLPVVVRPFAIIDGKDICLFTPSLNRPFWFWVGPVESRTRTDC